MYISCVISYYYYRVFLIDVEAIELSLGPFSALTNIEIFTFFREHAGQFGMAKFAASIQINGYIFFLNSF